MKSSAGFRLKNFRLSRQLASDSVSDTYAAVDARGESFLVRHYGRLVPGSDKMVYAAEQILVGLDHSALNNRRLGWAADEREPYLVMPMLGSMLDAGVPGQLVTQTIANLVAFVWRLHAEGVLGFEIEAARFLLDVKGRLSFVGGAIAVDSLRRRSAQLSPSIGDDLSALGRMARSVAVTAGLAQPIVETISELSLGGNPDTAYRLWQLCGEANADAEPKPWSASQRGMTRLLGRNAALKALEAAATRTIDPKDARAPLTVLLSGPAGCGKSRLLAALADSVRRKGFRVLLSQCAREVETESLPGLVTRVASLSGEPLEMRDGSIPELKPSGEQLRQADNFVRNLRRASREGPLLVLIEDVHSLDESQASLLGHMVRHLYVESAVDGSELAASIVMTQDAAKVAESPGRAVFEELRDEGVIERLRLAPLDAATVTELVSCLTGEHVTAAERQRIVDKSQGNPRFLRELARLSADERHRGRRPATIAEAMRRRTQLEPALERRVLEIMAVLRQPQSFDFLAEQLRTPAAAALYRCLSGLRVRDLVRLTEDSKFDLAHKELAETIEATMSEAERRSLSRRLGLALEESATSTPVQLARLFHQAQDKARALRYGLAAGKILLAAHANEQALAMFERLVPLLAKRSAAKRIEVLEQVAHLHAVLGAFDQAVKDWMQLVRLAGKSPKRARYWLEVARAHREKGELDRALECLDSGLEVAHASRKNTVILRLIAAKAIILLMMGRSSEALQLASEADRAGAFAGGSEMAMALNQLGLVYHRLGRLDEARKHVQRALAVSEESGELQETAQALHNLGVIESLRGDYNTALQHCSRSLAIKERIGDREAIATTALTHGVYNAKLYDLDQSRASGERALVLARRIGQTYMAAVALYNISELDFLTARYGACRVGRLKALRLLQRLKTLSELTTVQHALARLYVLMGDYEQAEVLGNRALKQALELKDGKQEGQAALVLGMISRERRDFSRAEELMRTARDRLDHETTRAEFFGCLIEHAVLLEAQDRRVEADAVIEPAVAGAREAGLLHELAHALVVQAGLAGAEREDVADLQLAEAKVIAERLRYREVAWQAARERARLHTRRGDARAPTEWAVAHRILIGIVDDIHDEDLRYTYINQARRLEVLRHGRSVVGYTTAGDLPGKEPASDTD